MSNIARPLPGMQERRVGGVAIDVMTSGSAPLYLVLLLKPDGTSGTPVAVTADEDAARLTWVALARRLKTARCIAHPDGGFRELGQSLPALVTGRPQPRRARPSRKHCRPAARLSVPPLTEWRVYRGEREIVCYE